MLIRAISDSIQQYAPENPLSGKFSLNLPKIASNLNKLALPIIILYACSNTQTALAGPVAYAICVAGCALLSTFATPLCIAGCLPAFTSPIL